MKIPSRVDFGFLHGRTIREPRNSSLEVSSEKVFPERVYLGETSQRIRLEKKNIFKKWEPEPCYYPLEIRNCVCQEDALIVSIGEDFKLASLNGTLRPVLRQMLSLMDWDANLLIWRRALNAPEETEKAASVLNEMGVSIRIFFLEEHLGEKFPGE